MALAWLVPTSAQALTIFLSDVNSTSPAVQHVIESGGSLRLAVQVADVPAPGLSAFQFDLVFDPAALRVENPNEAFRGAVEPFAPLGSNPFCATVRGVPSCSDPEWFLTSTGRSPLGIDEIDNTLGRLTVAFATSGDQALPTGGGVIALLDVIALGPSGTQAALFFENTILADNGEPPMAYSFTSLGLNVAIPEPGTAGLVVLALGALGLRSRLA